MYCVYSFLSRLVFFGVPFHVASDAIARTNLHTSFSSSHTCTRNKSPVWFLLAFRVRHREVGPEKRKWKERCVEMLITTLHAGRCLSLIRFAVGAHERSSSKSNYRIHDTHFLSQIR